MQLIRKSLKVGKAMLTAKLKNTLKMIEERLKEVVLSPILSNIVLIQLDEFMSQLKVKIEIGKKRSRNKA